MLVRTGLRRRLRALAQAIAQRIQAEAQQKWNSAIDQEREYLRGHVYGEEHSTQAAGNHHEDTDDHEKHANCVFASAGLLMTAPELIDY